MREFTVAVLDRKAKTFMIYVFALPITPIYLCRRAQIKALIVKKALIKIPAEYMDHVNVFLPDLVIKLSEHTRINDHTINLVKEKQLFYGLIFSRSIDIKAKI